jgi:Fic family protein
LLLEIHSEIIPNGGQWRKQQVFVSDQTYATNTFFSDTSEIEKQVLKLIEWYNQETKVNELHPVVLTTIFHYKFVKIHPFLDGNGRLARIISSLILLSYRIPPPAINNQDREKYIYCLRKGDLDDLSPLTNFIGERILASMDIILNSNENG